MRVYHAQRVSPKTLTGGNSIHRLPPIMIGRLTLSLRKAAYKSEVEWSLAGVEDVSNPEHGRHTSPFASVLDEGFPSSARGDIPLRTIQPRNILHYQRNSLETQ